MATLRLDGLSKRYKSDHHDIVAVDRLTLDVDDGELLILVGPSGCGKSTALRMIAGLEDITEGELTIDGIRMNERDSSQRDIAMVFQNYALYPHMSVYRNIAYPLRIAKMPKREIDERVRETARILQLSDLLDRRPGALSGGQRQRVAMGRALIRRAKAFLMDEPLSNLDAKLRVQMRAEITSIQRQINVTTVYVTHDQVEAMTMGDRVVVLRDGVLQQVAAPNELFWRPANTFVAGFIGSPPMNLFKAHVAASGGGMDLEMGPQKIHLRERDLAHQALTRHGSGTVIVGIRPEHLRLAGDDERGCVVRGTLSMVEHLGAEAVCHADIGAERVAVGEAEQNEDETSGPDNSMVARIQSKEPLGTGTRVAFAIDPDELRFFDAGTGDALA